MPLLSRTCAAFGAIWATTTALTGEGEPEQLRIGRVTQNFFDTLGSEAGIGRTFRPEDSRPGASPTLLMSWALFERRYGGDASIVGHTTLVNGLTATVIGVMPRGFRLLLPPDAAVPDDLQAWQVFPDAMDRGPRGQQFLRVVGRMRPGIGVAETRDDIAAVGRAISREFAEYGTDGRKLNAVDLQSDNVRGVRASLLGLFAGAAILLSIACVNVASLLLARAASRSKETALRLAIGASRARLLGHSLGEGLFLALLGGIAGLGVGGIALRGLVALRPDTLSRLDSSRIDGVVLAFTAVLSLGWGALFSLAPVVEAFRTDVGRSLQAAARTSAGPIRYRVRASLVVAQVTLGVVLLVGAGLLVRGFARLYAVDPGFHRDRMLTFRVAPSPQRYRSPDTFNGMLKEIQTRVAALPGVTSVGAISHVPYDDLPNWGGPYLRDIDPTIGSAPHADYRAVTPVCSRPSACA